VWHKHYDSCELGVALARDILARVDAAATSSSCSASGESARQDSLPRLQQAKQIGCRLPGSDHVFLFVGSPSATARPLADPPAGGATLISRAHDSRSSVLSMQLDASDTINAIAYVGPPLQGHAAVLARLVGLPLAYVAAGLGLPDKLVGQLAAANGGSVGTSITGLRAPPTEPGVYDLECDVLAALQQPWAHLLAHDQFPALREALLHTQPPGPGVAEDALQAAVQLKATSLMQRCADELPGYRLAVTAV
jgi:hypothetical protein